MDDSTTQQLEPAGAKRQRNDSTGAPAENCAPKGRRAPKEDSKKSAKRAARKAGAKERQHAQKVERHALMLQEAQKMTAGLAGFVVTAGYSQLLLYGDEQIFEQCESANSSAQSILSRVFERADKYNAKYAPQEISLVFQLYRVWKQAGRPTQAVVLDVGGGNGNLASLVLLLLQLPVVVCEKESPPISMRAEEKLPPSLAGN